MKFQFLGINVDIALIDNWKSSWRLTSVQFMTFIAFVPELYNGIIAAGLLEADPATGTFSAFCKTVAAVCIVLRNIKQQLPTPVTPPDTN